MYRWFTSSGPGLRLRSELWKQHTRTLRFQADRRAIKEATAAVGMVRKPETPMYKITLKRSPRGLPPGIIKVVKALGLKRGNSIYRVQSPIAAGSVLKIKELVAVENTTESGRVRDLLEAAAKSERAKGYVVLGRGGETPL